MDLSKSTILICYSAYVSLLKKMCIESVLSLMKMSVELALSNVYNEILSLKP